MFSLNEDINKVFTGLCMKTNHSLKLEYYCKSHNQLCCAACIAKVKYNGKGRHKDCEIYNISQNKKNKKESYIKNISKLGMLSKKLRQTVKEMKDIYEKKKENKYALRCKIRDIFREIRSELNQREYKLYDEINSKFDKFFCQEQFIKENEKLPDLIKTTLEKGKIDDIGWNDEKILPKLINDTINIENINKKMDKIFEISKDFSSKKNATLDFNLKKEEIEEGLLNKIKLFGGINIIDKKTEFET